MTPQTVARLAQIRNIVGIKEGAGLLQQVSEIIQLCDDQFTVLSGDDALTLPMLAVGWKGDVTVTGNWAPAQMAALVYAWAVVGSVHVRGLHYKLLLFFMTL